jgi:hypothetical protein
MLRAISHARSGWWVERCLTPPSRMPARGRDRNGLVGCERAETPSRICRSSLSAIVGHDVAGWRLQRRDELGVGPAMRGRGGLGRTTNTPNGPYGSATGFKVTLHPLYSDPVCGAQVATLADLRDPEWHSGGSGSCVRTHQDRIKFPAQ